MASETTVKTGARLLAEALAANGVERVFVGPEARALPIVDAVRAASIFPVVARLAIGAAFMAEATGRLGDGPGIALVMGAEAATAIAGLLAARRDATPTILLVVEAEPSALDAGATFGTFAKAVFAVDAAGRAVETITRAFATAANGRPGPVVVRLATAALDETAAAPRAIRPAPVVETHPGAAQMWDLQKRLWAAKRPIAVLGGPRWSEKAVRRFARFVDKFDLPVACDGRRQVLFDQTDPRWIGDLGAGGDPALARRIEEADLILLVGGDPTIAIGGEAAHRRTVVHVDAEAEAFGRVVDPDLAIHASVGAFAGAAEALEPPPMGVAWADWREAARADHETWRERIAEDAGESGVVATCARRLARLPVGAVLADGADAIAVRAGRLRRFRSFGTQVAPTETTAGYGLPAGIAAALADPERSVVVVADTESFEATAAELATAVEVRAAVIVVVLGGDHAHAPSGFDPDVAAIARAYGVFATTIGEPEAFGPAFERALASRAPALLGVADRRTSAAADA